MKRKGTLENLMLLYSRPPTRYLMTDFQRPKEKESNQRRRFTLGCQILMAYCVAWVLVNGIPLNWGFIIDWISSVKSFTIIYVILIWCDGVFKIRLAAQADWCLSARSFPEPGPFRQGAWYPLLYNSWAHESTICWSVPMNYECEITHISPRNVLQ